MYIQLTEICNMSCEHCCMNAKKTVGKTMSRSVYMDALQLAIRYGEHITLGGGEPTVHKEFFEFLDKAIEFYECGSLEYPPHIITNGKLTRKANKLLDMVDEDYPLHIELSRDHYHDEIDQHVVRRFEQHGGRRWKRQSDRNSAGIRRLNEVYPIGRALSKGVHTIEPKASLCCCETPLVDPEGRVWACGCKTHQLGLVWQRDVLDGYDQEFAHFGGVDPDATEACEFDLECAEDTDKSQVSDDPEVVLQSTDFTNEQRETA